MTDSDWQHAEKVIADEPHMFQRWRKKETEQEIILTYREIDGTIGFKGVNGGGGEITEEELNAEWDPQPYRKGDKDLGIAMSPFELDAEGAAEQVEENWPGEHSGVSAMAGDDYVPPDVKLTNGEILKEAEAFLVDNPQHPAFLTFTYGYVEGFKAAALRYMPVERTVEGED